jgi:hypothetical protein
MDASPITLGILVADLSQLPGVMDPALRALHRLLSLPDDVDDKRSIYNRALSWMDRLEGTSTPDIFAQARQEPLHKLLQKEKVQWASSWEGGYSAKEEGQHIQRLQAYVQAAADRAAGQLQQQQPELVQKLREALV